MKFIALLRAVNVGGRKVTMKELKEAAKELGYANACTLAASGNLIFETRSIAQEKIEAALEATIERTFGLFSEVMVRSVDEWSAIIKANPFPKKAEADPAHLVCVVCKDSPNPRAIDAWLIGLRQKQDAGEQLKVQGREIYIDYGVSIGQSKHILPRTLATGTGRNWNTVLKIQAMLLR